MNFHLMIFSSHLGGKDLELFLQVKQKSRIFPEVSGQTRLCPVGVGEARRRKTRGCSVPGLSSY